MINRDDPLPITKQCHILDLSRSSVYYRPAPLPDKDRELMRLIDEIPLGVAKRHTRKRYVTRIDLSNSLSNVYNNGY
jgi:hypothetical protein